MGGPCFVKVAAGSNRRVLGPSCTDNFQLVQFVYDGVQYHSCEHAFQAAKFAKGSSLRRKLDAAAPRRSESASMHGLRVWRLGGTRVSGPSAAGVFHPDWDRAKVEVMLSICRAKYAQHPELGQQLLLATGTAEIMGGPSTQWVYQGKRHDWGTWNGRIQTLCREELRPESERDSSLLESLHSLFRDYGVSDEVLVAGCRPQMPCAGGAALPAVKEEPLEPEVAMTVQQRPVCEADIPLILARDAAVYPTEEPLSASTLSELLRQQPSMSSVYYATRAHRHLNGDNRTGVASEEAEADGERDGTVIGFNVCFALRLPSWRLLLEGAISEANVVAGTLSDGTKHRHLATLDPTSNDVDTNVAVHCYHIEKFPKIAEHAGVSAPVLPGFGLTAIRDVRKKLPSKIKVVGMSALCVTGAGIFLFNKKFGFIDSPKYPDSAKEQIWEHVPSNAAAAAGRQTKLKVVSFFEGRAALQRCASACDVGCDCSGEPASSTAIFGGVKCRYLNDCRMLFATRETVPSSSIWEALSQGE